MGMFSEIAAAGTAEKLEKIILSAMNDSLWDDVRSTVKSFVRDNLVEWYYDKCSETWGLYKPNPKILKMFPVKKS